MSNESGDGTKNKRVCCPVCGDALDRKGICWNCFDEQNAEPVDDPDRLERRKAYRGGRWIVDGFIRTTRCSEAEAIAKAEKSGNIRFALELSGFSGLVDILADRWATEALRQLLLAEDKDILKTLLDCHKGGRYFPRKAKRGPMPRSGIHIEQEVLRLKRAGKTNGEIAKHLKTKTSAVAAAYNNITNKIARRQRQG